jgi:RIO kinase 2
VGNLVGYFRRKYPREVEDVDVRGVVDAIAEGSFETVVEHS